MGVDCRRVGDRGFLYLACYRPRIEMRLRRLAVICFWLQAVAIAGWWVLLLVAPTTRQYFAIRGASFAVFGLFALGDLAIVVLGSVLVGLRGGRGWALYAAWLVSGALLYATCFVVAAAITGVSPPLGAALMISASVVSVIASVILTRDAHVETLSTGSAA
jgi:hypothetical protein